MIQVLRIHTFDNGVGGKVCPSETLETPLELESKKKLDEWKNQLMLERSMNDGESRTIYLDYREIK
jgi:hypothetical protein